MNEHNTIPTSLITGLPHPPHRIMYDSFNGHQQHITYLGTDNIDISNINLIHYNEFVVADGELFLDKYNPRPCDIMPMWYSRYENQVPHLAPLSIAERVDDRMNYFSVQFDNHLIIALESYFKDTPDAKLSIDYLSAWDNWINTLSKRDLLLNSRHEFSYVAERCRMLLGKEENI